VPPRILCCARPLYDWGMLGQADFLLRQLLDALGPALARGVPIIGLEPACVASFRDEVVALFPHDDRAKWLKRQTYLLSEFLDQHCKELNLPQIGDGKKALLQIHCHEHAVLDPKAEQRVLQRMGIEAHAMPTGCCGMAGSFGFEADKYHWSRKIAEHALLPQLSAAPDALVVANGFSCREQIEQLGGRGTKHISDLIAEAMGFSTQRKRPALPAIGDVLLAAGGVAAAGLLLGIVAAQARRNRGVDHRAAAREASAKAPAITTAEPMAAEMSPR
jgi:Fe-S oxidoreductase